jgi:hypothetical protein
MGLITLYVQGFDKGIQSKGAAKTRFRKAPKSDNVYIKLLVKVSPLALLTHMPSKTLDANLQYHTPSIASLPMTVRRYSMLTRRV